MSEPANKSPDGCLGCNPEEIKPMLDAHGIHVEEVPRPRHGWGDVFPCPQCGRTWVLMPRTSDEKKPVA